MLQRNNTEIEVNQEINAEQVIIVIIVNDESFSTEERKKKVEQRFNLYILYFK